jgi:hypothetical protein
MNVQVSLRTADGVPIVGATVALADSSGTSSGSGATTDANGLVTVTPSDNSFSVTASMTNYREQSTSISVESSGSSVWDDPGSIVSGSGGQLNVEIRLGRLVPSPTVPFQESIITITPQNPSTVVPMQHTFTVDDGEYAFLFAGNRNFWAVTSPNMLGSPTAPGWGAFTATSAAIEPRMTGHFAWLEWAPPGGDPPSLNRYLVGLWRARSSVVSGSKPRDAIVFYTPNTDPARGYLSDSPPYRGNYPYGLNQSDNPTKLTQRYVTLGLRYLFNEKFLAYQLLAAARDSLLIVPIQPFGNWEVFQRPEGVARLLAEAILFEHRQRVNPDDPSGTVDTAPSQNFVRTRAAQHLPPPTVGTVVTAGFSAGLCPITQLIRGVPANGQYPTRSWKDESGNSYFANPSQFVAGWREIWDFDGYARCIGSASEWAGMLATWRRANGHDSSSDRVVRCYHTDYTGWSASSLDAMNAAIGPPAQGSGATPAQGSKAAEREGSTGTAVWLHHTYLTGNGPARGWDESATADHPPDTPAFWTGVDPPKEIGFNAHQAVPMISFAHAAGLSQLQKL